MNAPKLPKTTDRPGHAGAVPTVLSQFEISGKSVRLLSIDALEPREAEQERITYVQGEIANFEFNGHRYALVSDCLLPESPPEKEDAALAPPDAHTLLTNRELQICQLICMGYLTKQVAARLKISEFTVRSYLKTIYCKLSVRSRGAMVYRFTQTFLHSPPRA
ncbi:MAG TPA: LuxR C-terminal-related transcriptional regulator [Steroidobacter sp.]|uniref:response regulator transcription factor n=1 Tax=Steroidobacter sp. TaxID=1978227 RepID=UPI002EDAD7FE